MESITAKNIVKNFINQQNKDIPIDPNYYYEVDENPVDFIDQWYFNLIIRCKIDIPIEEQELWAGAVGYVINKETKKIEFVSFPMYCELERLKELKENLLNYIDNDLKEEVNLKKLKEISSLDIAGLRLFKTKLESINSENISQKHSLILEMIEYLSLKK